MYIRFLYFKVNTVAMATETKALDARLLHHASNAPDPSVLWTAEGCNLGLGGRKLIGTTAPTPTGALVRYMHLYVNGTWITVTVVANNWGANDGYFWTNVFLNIGALPDSRLSRIGQLLVTYLGTDATKMGDLLEALTANNPRDKNAAPYLLHLGGKTAKHVTKNCADNDESLFNVAGGGGVALCVDLRAPVTAVVILNTLATILDVPRVGDAEDDTLLDADASAAETANIRAVYPNGKVHTDGTTKLLRAHGLSVVGVHKKLDLVTDEKLITDGKFT